MSDDEGDDDGREDKVCGEDGFEGHKMIECEVVKDSLNLMLATDIRLLRLPGHTQ